MSENQSNVQTSVQQVDLDIDNWLGAPGADNIITAANQEPTEIKPNVFSNKKQDLSFLDKEDESEEDTPKTEEKIKEEAKEVFKELDKEFLNEDEEEAPKPKSDRGRPRTEKSGLVEFLKKRIESNEMFAFDDYDETKESLDDYLSKLGEKDIEELWKANIDNMKNEVASQTPQQFFEALPQELQYAAKYVADGGEDLKGLFKALAQTEEIKSLDPTDENDQENIIRSYLQATKFGTPDEIEEEIDSWKDLGVLDKKAQKFKPKLDKMQEQVVQAKIREQEYVKKQQEEAAEAYMQNVFETLRPGELNGLKLDKKTQALLYTGLVQPQYSSMNGRPTNLLGHLLEKYQFVEPNYSIIAEALWLLSDPDGYRSELKKQGKNAAVEQTVRQLKTEQSKKSYSSHYEEEEEKPRKIARPQNIFKR